MRSTSTERSGGGSDPVQAPRRRRPPQQRTGPGGLTAAGAVVLAIGGTLLGAVLSRMFTGGLGLLFGLVFLATAVIVALKVRTQDLVFAAIAPPIAFLTALVLTYLVFPTDDAAGLLEGTGVDVVKGLAYKAGLLWGGTALAGVVALARKWNK